MKMLTSTLFLLALIPVQASAAPARPEARVAFSDLDLSSEAGIRALDRRLVRAVATVCPDPRGTVDLATKRDARRCKTDTIAGLAAQRSRVLAAHAAPAQLAAGTR